MSSEAGTHGRDDVRLWLLSSRSTIDGHLPRMVLDTDTFNEIDDQFALVHAVLSEDRVDLTSDICGALPQRPVNRAGGWDEEKLRGGSASSGRP